MKSMVMTSKGELISASSTDIQLGRRATLTRTQRRNRNRCIRKILDQLREGKGKEVIADNVTFASEEKLLDRSLWVTLPQFVIRDSDADSVKKYFIPEYTPTKVNASHTVETFVPKPEEKTEVLVDVKPYATQFVSKPRQLQIISEDEMERFQKVRKQNFEHFQRIHVFSSHEQDEIVNYVFNLRDKGRAGLLKRRTYSEPQKWMQGKGKITIQYGCCYNYAYDSEGNPPGIIRHDEVDPMPTFIKRMIKRMVAWHVLPAECVPNSCIINIYEEGDCIPPHIDHHDFVRPFCTVSFINKCNIMFGTDLQTIGPGEFRGPVKIPLPVGSVLVLKGNGADLAKHCIPAVPYQRVSITFRRMSEDKVPFRYRPDPELEHLRPLEL